MSTTDFHFLDNDLEKADVMDENGEHKKKHSTASDSSYFIDKGQQSSSYHDRERATSTPLLEAPTKMKVFIKFLPRFPPLLKRETTVPLFYCLICLENHALTDAYIVHNCSKEHKFCRSSIQVYLGSQLQSGVISYRCPCYDECNGIFQDFEIRGLLDERDFEKYTRFRQLKTNPDFRECPSCGESTIGSVSCPEIICSGCGCMYCCE
jgi:hypothetical protein